jgi:hypothetical protein
VKSVEVIRERNTIDVEALLMLPLCAAHSPCHTAKPQSVCDRFKKLTPTLETAVTILRRIARFADRSRPTMSSGRRKGAGDDRR